MKKKLLSGILAATMVTGLLAGCGNSDNPSSQASGNADGSSSTSSEAPADNTSSDAPPASSDEQITLRFSWWGGDERLAATLEVIDQFQDLHPNITIEAEYGSSDGYHDKLATQLQGGTAPDIIQVDPETFPQYVTGGADYFIDLNDLNFDFSNFEESYIGQQVNGRYDGHQFGIPTGLAGGAVLVNQDLADQFNIDFTKQFSWDQLLEWGRQVHEADESVYLLCTNQSYITNLIFFNMAKQLSGKTLIDQENVEFTLSEEQLTQIYSYIKALYDNNVIPPASYMAQYEGDNLQSDPNWMSGKYVCTLSYISTIEVMTAANTNANYSVGMLPKLDDSKNDGYIVNCPQVLGIAKSCEHPEAAAMFLDYFFNNDTALETLGTTRSVPPTEKARTICADKGILNPLVANAADIASSYSGLANDKYSSLQEPKQILNDQIEAVGYAQSTPENAAKETLNLMNNYISNIQK